VQQTPFAAEYFGYTPQRVADLLAVFMWADSQLSKGMRTVVTSSPRVGLGTVHFLDLFLLSVRQVSDARSELTLLDRSQLLAGFEIWAERQRAVRKLAASGTDSL